MVVLVKRDLVIIPLIIGIFVWLFDYFISLFAINYLDIGIYEMNPLGQDEDGKFDTLKTGLLTMVHLTVLLIAAYLLATKITIPDKHYSTFKQVEKKHKPYIVGYILITMSASVKLVVCLWNLIILLSNISGIFQNFYHFYSVNLLLGLSLGLYWYYSFTWRYLTLEARAKYWYLKLPYKIGFMKDVI